MRGLKCSVYEGGLKVPTLVRWPGHIEAGRSSDLISSFQDWMPTLLEVAGTECPQGLDGISLVPTLEGKGEQAEHEALYFEYGGQQALRAGRWKAVRRKLHKGNLETELYDLEADPAEAKNLARSRPEVLARMVALLESSRTPSKQFPLPGIDKPVDNKK
jgi:arylsulfatase A-like enzyme